MITPAQHARHNTEWAAVCALMAWNVKDDVRRLAFYRDSGLPESRKDWNPRTDFDKFLDACRRIRGERGNIDRERVRLVHSIRAMAKKAGFEEAYLRQLSTDLTGLACWDELALDQLTNLRNAVHNRAVRKKAKPAAVPETNPF